jgi:predicted DNA-binding transcriptional regulator AlpA
MTSPEDLAARPPETAGPPSSASGKLINIDYIRNLFKLGRTAAYQLTHRPGFPDPVEISPHGYRWWASEVDEFAATLRLERCGCRLFIRAGQTACPARTRARVPPGRPALNKSQARIAPARERRNCAHAGPSAAAQG